MGYSFKSANILLPKNEYDYSKWSVIACDQYTSNLSYWQDVEKIVGNNPSTLNIIYPEVYLGEENNRTEKINQTMINYSKEVLEEAVHDGFVLVSRKIASGNRLGLVGVIDLENYDYTPGSKSPIRATEGTIQSRIPPRQKIRRNASLELPHIMVLIDDPNHQLIEPLYENRSDLRKLYDFDLMKNGGHISGYAIEGHQAKDLTKRIESMEDASQGFFLAMGDGNHSLATAKACYEELKQKLSKEEAEHHPSRYALVEVVNLHSEALIFEPIHRVIFNSQPVTLLLSFKDYLKTHDIRMTQGDEITFVSLESFSIENKQGRLPVDILQTFLDEYLKDHPEMSIDYIHGKKDVESLVNDSTTGILLNSIDKNSLFTAIDAGGVLPRKTFSMGEANEKRYYLECRKI